MGDIIRGTTSLAGLYRGNTEIQSVYRGNTEIWTGSDSLSSWSANWFDSHYSDSSTQSPIARYDNRTQSNPSWTSSFVRAKWRDDLVALTAANKSTSPSADDLVYSYAHGKVLDSSAPVSRSYSWQIGGTNELRWGGVASGVTSSTNYSRNVGYTPLQKMKPGSNTIRYTLSLNPQGLTENTSKWVRVRTYLAEASAGSGSVDARGFKTMDKGTVTLLHDTGNVTAPSSVTWTTYNRASTVITTGEYLYFFQEVSTTSRDGWKVTNSNIRINVA